jgi:histidinol-phosphate aminotransferase
MVVVDEAYQEFSGEPSLVEQVDDLAHLIVMRTLSKAFGRAGLRLGYAVAHPEIIRCFLKVKAPYNLSVLALSEGVRALQPGSVTQSEIAAIIRQRERVAAALTRLPGVEKVFPSRANFVLFRSPKARRLCRMLASEGIIVRDRSSLPSLRDCIRVSIGTAEENSLFLDRIRCHLEEPVR